MFPIPDTALDDRLGILGTAGSGKTYSALATVERLLSKRGRVVIIDPMGVCWGLRSMADGKTPSPFNVAIFGGAHKDLPLPEHAGSLIGETAATMAESCIIDLSELPTKSAERRFMVAFLDAIFRAAKTVRQPFHLVIDEADLFAPQKPQAGDETLLGLMEQICRRGRVLGFIPWLISQRPAVLNKNVLSMMDGLVTFRMTSPQDRNALDAWIEGQADKEQGRVIKGTLPAKQTGHAVIWIPTRDILLQDAVFPIKATFDSSRSPKRGEKKVAAHLKPIDIAALEQRLSTIKAEVQANDPAKLKAEVRRLTAALAKAQNGQPPADLHAYARGKIDGYADAAKDLGRQGNLRRLSKTLADYAEELLLNATRIEEWAARRGPEPLQRASAAVALPHPPASSPTPAPGPRSNGSQSGGMAGQSLPVGEKAILIACAQYPAGAMRDQLTVLTGYKRSTRDAYIQRLREKGFVDVSGYTVQATEVGIEALGFDYEPLPTGHALQAYWLQRLPEGERAILNILIGRFPASVDRAELDEGTGFKRSTRDAYLQRLKSRRLVNTTDRGTARAAEELFA